MDVIHKQEYDSFNEARAVAKRIKKEQFNDSGTSFHTSIKKKENGKYLLVIEGKK